MKAMRESSLSSIGLGDVLEIFHRGALPISAEEAVDKVFGSAGSRGSLLISGANGVVGAGKAMQLSARLHRYGVKIVGLDFHGAPDGIGRHHAGLVRAFGPDEAGLIMGNIVRLTYDGRQLPSELRAFSPRFLLEAIPEILAVKRTHYEIVREAFPGIEIRSVTSGFPSSELGVPIAHPAFPHEINKIWEVVEPESSAITHLFWALGMIPIPVADRWSFVLDVLFCGLTHAAIQYHRMSNMPFWKIDKYVRRMLGPNPLRAHDAIGAAGANFLTWSCLHHLAQEYGALFTPTPELEERKTSGADWYPLNHFRPLVDWKIDAKEEEALRTWILGPLFQMTSLLLHEDRGRLAHINAIGELCAQFRRGVLAVARDTGADGVIRTVEVYHALHPEAARGGWHPAVFEQMDRLDWQQLYVNAEHDGNVGVIAISRESYNGDVDAELNRAVDWLRGEGINRVILTGDFHLSTQMVGADTSEFYRALEDVEAGYRISWDWSKTARRLTTDFATSVGFIGGKRCLGGMLELMLHCKHVVAVEEADLGLPEVTLPVVPGMEGCHWPFRKARPEDWPRILRMLLTGRSVRSEAAVGWLVDYAGPMDQAIRIAWGIARGGGDAPAERPLNAKALRGVPNAVPDLSAGSPATEAARKAILDCVQASCGSDLMEALIIQAKHAAGFMGSDSCKGGRIGADYQRTVSV